MEFALSSEQTLLQESLTRALESHASLAKLRERVAAGNTRDQTLVDALAEFGVYGVITPGEWGGADLKMLDAALVSEALGRFVAPVSFVADAVVAPLALIEGGSPAQQQEWLPQLASGHAGACLALSEAAAGARDGAGVTEKNGKLTGKALFAFDAVGADIAIVATKDKRLFLVRDDHFTLKKLPTIDATRSIGELTFKDAPAEPLKAEALPRLLAAARIMLAADTLGAASHMLTAAVAYAQQREQFGRLIGSFQAVKHLCAEMAAQIEPARSLMWYAAYAFDEAPEDAARMAAHAKAHLSEIGTFVARTSTEVHGGIGITDLLGLHYWFKRIGLNRQLFGGPERLRAEAAAHYGWSATA